MFDKAIRGVFDKYSSHARRKRALMFWRAMEITPETKILDLGGGTGAHIASVLEGAPCVVTVADVLERDLEKASGTYGFNTIKLAESGPLPFSDKAFDIVFCSSVIEHATGEKARVLAIDDTAEFTKMATSYQAKFAAEIERIAVGYFVQTPNRHFPIESHSWLPFIILLLSRRDLKKVLEFFGRWWPKKTAPDWHLLTRRDLQALFPAATIQVEQSGPFVKSIIAVKSNKRNK